MKKYCFGVDVGGTTIKLGLFTVEGKLLEKWEIPTRTENQSEAVLPDVAAAVLGKMKEKEIEKEEVEGVGFPSLPLEKTKWSPFGLHFC